MLAVKKNEEENEMQSFSMEESAGDLLDTIDFDDLFAGFSDGDVLPDLEMDHEILAEVSSSESDQNKPGKSGNSAPDSVSESPRLIPEKKTEPQSESVSKPASKEAKRSGKDPPVKKKAKVDWTPELHRRFVTAVERLGIDKAVPSRILEIMGIDCLTRHNIASHLQKYRSHRKHLQAREAEAARWSRRRQIYGTAAAATRQLEHWINAPTPTMSMGFPLHVWGHPSFHQSIMHAWPKHHVAPPSLALPPPLPSLGDLSFWHPHHQYVVPPPPAAAQTLPQTPDDIHPSKESIDAAIGDVIRKPWLPLPLGLKPPSMEGVMVELQRQGVSTIPPTLPL